MKKGMYIALIVSAVMLIAVTAVRAEITAVDIDENGNAVMSVTKTTEDSGKGIIAVYDTKGQLKRISVSDEVTGTGEKQIGFADTITVGENEILKAFLWKTDGGTLTLEPIETAYIPQGQPTPEPSGDGIIHLMGDSIDASGVDNVTVDGSVLTITAGGEYTVEGTLNDGQITVNSENKKDVITINLNGVNVTSTTGNALDGLNGKVTLVPTSQDSTFKSTADGGTGIYSKHDLTIKSDGTLNAISEYGNGIRCKNDIEIGVCDLVVDAGKHGIKGDQSVKITKKNKTVTVTSGGEGIKSDQLPETDPDTNEYVTGGTITINGGTINITAKTTTDANGVVSYSDGIQAYSLLKVTDGNITVNSQQDCMQADEIVDISGGTFDLTAYGGAPQTVSANNPEAPDSCKGVKAGSLVYISGGTFNINTYDDAVHSNNTVRIAGGSITAATGDDGIHGDSYLFISDTADINITKSYEGIEAAKIYVSGGETRVVSADDGANAAGDEPTSDPIDLDTVQTASVEIFAGSGGNGGWGGPNWGGEDTASYGYMEVSGGLLYIEAEGDGFDSNGSALISGGTVLVNGPTSGGNGVFDIGDNSGDTLTITGGTVIGAGTSDMSVTPDSAEQYYVVTSSGSSGGMGGGRPVQSGSSGFSTQSAGKAFKLTDASRNEIITYVPSKNYAWVFVSTPDMQAGSYTLGYGGTVSGGEYTGKGNYGIVNSGEYSGSSSLTLTAVKK